jgi:Sulfate permease family
MKQPPPTTTTTATLTSATTSTRTNGTVESNNNSNSNMNYITAIGDPLESSSNNCNSNTNSGNSSSSSSGIYRRAANTSSSLSLSTSSSLFVSRHRKILDRIAVDSTESRRYSVPNPSPPPPPPSLYRNGNSNGSFGGNNGSGSVAGVERRASSCCAKLFLFLRRTVTARTWDDWTSSLLPMYTWLRVYEWKRSFTHDLVAGLTVGVMIIPQSMSYAKLAGLPVEYGLYSALVPVYAYALFGSSRQLAVGPVAIVSLLLSTGLVKLLSSHGISKDDADDTNSNGGGGAQQYQALYNQLAIQTSLLVGVTNIVMGLLRMGFVTIFLCT